MDPFSTLGLPRRYEIDLPQLESRYRELQKALHPDRHAGASASQRRMSLLKAVEVNDAYRALKDDLRRAEALLAAYSADRAAVAQEARAEDPEFLMQMLELREALGEAREHNHAERVRELAAQVERLQDDARSALTAAFDALPAAPGPEQLAAVHGVIGRLKYFRRFLDEVSALHEEGIG